MFKFLTALKLTEVRKKILFSLFIILIFRILAHVPVPGVDTEAIRQYFKSSAIFGIFDFFSGGGFQNFSIVTLGLSPYINASIIMQLFTIMVPRLEELQKEGEQGREKINQYTRYLTVPISFFQAYSVYFLLSSQGVIESLDIFSLVILLVTLTCGALLLMWVGDLVTEYGVGNGISLLIFVGIISRVPVSSLQFVTTLTPQSVLNSVIFLLVALLVIIGVVLVNEGTRNIPLEYGRHGFRGDNIKNYLPIKVNQAGVIPIIFAISIVMIPSLIGGPMQAVQNPVLQKIGLFLVNTFVESAVFYNVFYFLLVVGFTYFYTSIQFNPKKISDDVKKRGGFIPGIRPGRATSDYLNRVVSRITLVGALFLGLVAILPFLVQNVFAISAFSVGGTGILIVVSVVLETIRQVESMLVTRNYEGFLK